MSENKLTNCAGIAAMPRLLELNLSGNRLLNLSDLRGLGSLKTLNVSNNKIKTLAEFPLLPELETLDLGGNQIEENGEKELAELGECESLKTLLMAGNPWVDEKGEDMKKEVLIALGHLSIAQVNELDLVTPEDIAEAKTEKAARE